MLVAFQLDAPKRRGLPKRKSRDAHEGKIAENRWNGTGGNRSGTADPRPSLTGREGRRRKMNNGVRSLAEGSGARAIGRREFLRDTAILAGSMTAGAHALGRTAESQPKPKEIVLAEGTALKTLNPYRSISTPERHFISMIFQRLGEIAHPGKIIGELAASWGGTEGGR